MIQGAGRVAFLLSIFCTSITRQKKLSNNTINIELVGSSFMTLNLAVGNARKKILSGV